MTSSNSTASSTGRSSSRNGGKGVKSVAGMTPDVLCNIINTSASPLGSDFLFDPSRSISGGSADSRTSLLESSSPGASGLQLSSTTNSLEVIGGFQHIIHNEVKDFVSLSARIGTVVRQQAETVLCLFEDQKAFIMGSLNCPCPETTGSGPSQARRINQIKTMAEEALRENLLQATHLKAIASTIGFMGWVISGDNPSSFIHSVFDETFKHYEEILEQSEVTNVIVGKVNFNVSSKADLNMKWLRSWRRVCRSLNNFVLAYFPNGLKWKKN